MSLRLAHLGRFVLLSVGLALAGIPRLAADVPPPATVTFVHINDVYEIDTMAGGREGGLARVATLIDQQRRRGPVLTTLGGDLLSPSALDWPSSMASRLPAGTPSTC